MALCFEGFNNCQKLAVECLISSFCWYYHLKGKSHWVPPVQVDQSQLTENSTNNIARSINFNRNIIIRIKIIKDLYLYKRLSQLNKNLPSLGSKKTQSGALYKRLGLNQKRFYQIFAFKLSHFDTNLYFIHLDVANPVNDTAFTNMYRICYWKIYPYDP